MTGRREVLSVGGEHGLQTVCSRAQLPSGHTLRPRPGPETPPDPAVPGLDGRHCLLAVPGCSFLLLVQWA